MLQNTQFGFPGELSGRTFWKGQPRVWETQVSHDPPISALHATNTKRKIQLPNWNKPVPKFHDSVTEGRKEVDLGLPQTMLSINRGVRRPEDSISGEPLKCRRLYALCWYNWDCCTTCRDANVVQWTTFASTAEFRNGYV
ncbi:hypothetical protein R1flu_013201 [Riccia fluitans]|uniref:Uncharacterized protein n=1 Tax=Riccia fluitans TaxID=41844 RepID=A0ABD1YCW6_9MARC